MHCSAQLTLNRDLLYVACALHWPCLLPCRCSVRCAVQLLECERQQLRLPSRAHTDTALTNRRCLAHAVAQPCCALSPVWQSTVTASTNSLVDCTVPQHATYSYLPVILPRFTNERLWLRIPILRQSLYAAAAHAEQPPTVRSAVQCSASTMDQRIRICCFDSAFCNMLHCMCRTEPIM